jgi:hypothetical protein
MADSSWEHAAEARAALNAIVTDPEHGTAALSSPRTMSNLLKDLLPDAPREKNLLVAAAEAGLADTLNEHVSQGMDPDTAISLTASSFSARSPLTPDACRWVTGEIAVALGISETSDAALISPPPGTRAGGAVATEVSPGYDSRPAGQYPPGQFSPGQGASSDRQAEPDSVGSARDSYSRAPDSVQPVAGSSPGGSAVASPGKGAPDQGWPGQGSPGQGSPGQGWPGQGWPGQGAPSSHPSSPGYQPGQGPATTSGHSASQPPGQGSYQPGTGYSPPAAGYASGYMPPSAGYTQGPSGYTPPTAFSPAENPQAYGPGVVGGMPAMTGASYQPVARPGSSRRTNTMAVTALVLGFAQFIGWIIFLLPGLLAAILAIVLGFVSMKQMRRSGEAGRGMAITGVILGFLGILIVAILVAVGVASVNSQTTG